MATSVVALLVGIALAQQPEPFSADPPKACDACEGWNAAQPPFRVFGNTWYVGTAGLSAVPISSPAGHVLLDAGLPQSAPREACRAYAKGARERLERRVAEEARSSREATR